MILIDLSQLMISNIMMSMKTANELDEDLGRSMILNSIRLINNKFGKEYGEIVICCDSGSFWRREIFPYYKSGRKKARDDSTLDWKRIFEILGKIKSDLKEYFHYRVVQVERAEADDIIAALCKNGSIEYINNNNKILIVSGDKDFVQLHKYPNVAQYDPVGKKKIVHNNPYNFLKEHIIRGDVGDGVPNMLSPDNSFVMSIRQKPITKKVINTCMNEEDPKIFCGDEKVYANYIRNKTMIDLDMVPSEISSAILTEFEAQAGKTKGNIVKYFMQNNLSNLFNHINDF